MIRTLPFFALAISLPLTVFIPERPARANDLDVKASTPDVTISTRPAGRRSLRLPSLEYTLTVDASCRASLAPATLSLNIADTRLSMAADKLAGDSPLQFSIAVPAAQIAPVTIDRFCVNNDPEAPGQGGTTVRIEAALSVQASLLCASEETNEMTYSSETLDVILICDHSIDQEPTTGTAETISL
jgi:hypothetical protein